MAAKKLFDIPYAGVDKSGDYDLLIGQNGEYSVIMRMVNPVLRFSAHALGYDEFHHLLINVVKLLGDGYLLQKQDIISRKKYHADRADEYLQQKYNDHFEGRECLQVETYITITRQVKKGAFYTYDPKILHDFRQVIGKITAIVPAAEILNEASINRLVLQLLSMNFSDGPLSLDNVMPRETDVLIGNRAVRSINLINIDSIDLPPEVYTYIELNEKESMRGFPVDFLSFLLKVPGCDVIVFNQLIEIPSQVGTLRKLEQKKKRHSGIPDPANQMCVEDIDRLLTDVARENQMLVNCHFNMVIAAEPAILQKAANYVESSLFGLGIIPCKNAYNQLELFRSILPGNGVELKHYDWFLTTCDAAACFFFKESLPKNEPSDFLIRFTDRQGIPVGIDPADLPMRTGRINNRNKFVLGPSGSGKSFFMNALIEQYMLYNMDMVIVDTGHSYSGLCAYFGGKYITYTDSKPITMNPFQIRAEEYNIEKKDFLVTLIGLLWKGADGQFTQVERDVIAHVLSAYFGQYFDQDKLPTLTRSELAGIRKQVLENMKISPLVDPLSEVELEIELDDLAIFEFSVDDEQLLDGLRTKDGQPLTPFRAALEQKYAEAVQDEKKKRLKAKYPHVIDGLSFNSFYLFALEKIPQIKQEERIPFEIDEFRYVLKKFYRGGEFDQILNEPADQSLFTERFIVFEIDAIKEHRVLFPIVTLIIMDVFIQKMRFRSDRRKSLVVEEAWKAIASPLMAGYLLYLYKTVRKFWGEAIVVTQELGDIIGNAVVKDSILNNSDTICLLDQTKFKDNYKEIAALLAINETERRKIFTINQLDNMEERGRFKEVYIRRGAVGEVYGVEVSLEQYLTFSTEKPEKSAIEIYVRYLKTYPRALDFFVADLKESGMTLGQFVSYINQRGMPHCYEISS